MSRPRVAACFSITMDAEVLDPPLGRVEAAQRSEGIDRTVAMAFRSREVLAVSSDPGTSRQFQEHRQLSSFLFTGLSSGY